MVLRKSYELIFFSPVTGHERQLLRIYFSSGATTGVVFHVQGLELWCLTPHSTLFQLYRGSRFFGVEETGVPGENHRPAASYRQTFSHNAYRVHLAMSGI